MKQLFMAVFAAAALTTPALAQATGGPITGVPPPGIMAAGPMGGGPMAGGPMHLTPDQRQKIAPIMKATHDQMRSILQDAHNREMAALSADHRTQVQQIVDQANAAIQNAMPSMPAAGSNGASPHDMAGMTAIHQQHVQFVNQIDAVLTPAESQNVVAIGRDVHAKLVALHESAINQVKPFLNADQKRLLDQMPMAHHGMPSGHPDDAGAYLLMGAMAHMRLEMHP